MGCVDEQYESKIVCRPEDLYFTIAHGFWAACPMFFFDVIFCTQLLSIIHTISFLL